MRWLVLLAALLAILVSLFWWIFMPLPGAEARPATGERRELDRDGRTLVYYRQGNGGKAPQVFLAASAGREVSDCNELADALVQEGYQTIAVEAPGIGGASLLASGATLYDLVEDFKAVYDAEAGGRPAVFLGHAFGNRVVRATASRYPDSAHALVLVAAGGKRPVPEKAAQALNRCFDPRRTVAQRLQDVRYAFFAGDNPVPDYWQRGWHVATALLQGAATAAVDGDEWWGAGGAPMLVVQGSDDRIAPKEDTADLLREEFPERIEVAVIAETGHAILPEKPAQVAAVILDYLSRQVRPSRQAPARH